MDSNLRPSIGVLGHIHSTDLLPLLSRLSVPAPPSRRFIFLQNLVFHGKYKFTLSTDCAPNTSSVSTV